MKTDKIRGAFRKKFEEIDERANLTKYGIDILRNELLQARIAESREIIEQIFEALDVSKKIDMQEKLIRLITLPWGRGGDRGLFAQAVVRYEMILRYWHDMYNTNNDTLVFKQAVQKLEASQKVINETANQASVLLQKNVSTMKIYGVNPMKFFMPHGQVKQLLESFGLREILPFGWIVYDIGWLSMDVAPQYAAIIQGATQAPYWGPPQDRPSSLNLVEVARNRTEKTG